MTINDQLDLDATVARAAASAVVSPPTDRAAIAGRLWQVAEHNIIAEWICCDPINPTHQLCVQGDATLRMVRALLVDDPEAAKPAAPLLDAVLAVLGEQTDRAAVLREAADRMSRKAAKLTEGLDDLAIFVGKARAAEAEILNREAAELRRLAVEAHDTGTQQPCPTVCDPDCDAHCHEAHQPTWKRGHQPATHGADEPAPVAQQHAAEVRRVKGRVVAVTKAPAALGTPDAELEAVVALAGEQQAAAADGEETRTTLPCTWARTCYLHAPHDWEPQPGMDPVHCPGSNDA